MCNRYVSPDQAAIERHWHIGRQNPPRWWEPEIFPRAQGPFVRSRTGERELVVGQWALIPSFATTPRLRWSTNNARAEEVSQKASFRDAWRRGQRCIIPAASFDEPCWESGRCVWWRFRRVDGSPWGLAGLWNAWVDRGTGEIVESYTMLTINADLHPLMSRMHKPDPRYAADDQDKRSVIAIGMPDIDQWLTGSIAEASMLLRAPPIEQLSAGPVAL